MGRKRETGLGLFEKKIWILGRKCEKNVKMEIQIFLKEKKPHGVHLEYWAKKATTLILPEM